jgi:hypothetical protein
MADPQWIGEEIMDCDMAAPESMAGPMYSRRFHLPAPVDGVHALITVGFYCRDLWQNGGEPIEFDQITLTEPPPASERYCIEQQIEFMRCRDPQNPGDTEEWCDYVYRSSWFARAEPFPEEQIKALMENFKPEYIEWDGSQLASWIESVSCVEPVEDENWERRLLTPDLLAAVREILWQRDDGMNNDEWLATTFEFEDCDACGLGAKAHKVGPDPLGNRHAWCNIGTDPAFAIKIARENAERGDTTKAANGFSEEDLRAERFESAIRAIGEPGSPACPFQRALTYRTWAVADDPEQSEFGKQKLAAELDWIAGIISGEGIKDGRLLG